MGAEVHDFAAEHAKRASPSDGYAAFIARNLPGLRRRYSFAQVAVLLSLDGTQRTMIAYLRKLHSQCDMPLPINPRLHKGEVQSGALLIGTRSVWCAIEFDAWLDSRRSPPPAAPGAFGAPDVPPLPALVRDDMAHRAAMLGMGGR